ncbi:hypothetical protein TRICI_006789 [Trichomonascus ciferrii]|uniref:catechol O-methyltransferase n=1 Tax=Trichomonascus ciferrii TaxID=44093 RepID=A0A642UHI0_9ASCO|nr:hypothetical protein TRICI_006789 [Trichomonascus ciferrii]
MSTKEQRLRDYIVSKAGELKRQPRKILEEMDYYCFNKEPLMNLGLRKGTFLTDKLKEHNVAVMAELGGYVGFSAILFAMALPSNGKLYSFEINQEFANIAQEILQLAGLDHMVEIIVGPSHEKLVEIANNPDKAKSFDAVLIDHLKEVYVPDMRTLESLDLVREGCLVMADNTVYPGAPEYLEYIRMTPAYKQKFIQSTPNPNGKEYPGRWDIIWKNEAVDFLIPIINITDSIEISQFIKYVE